MYAVFAAWAVPPGRKSVSSGCQNPESESGLKRFWKSFQLLKGERENREREELVRMEAVLYTFAMKFLKKSQLKRLKEAMNMTILGEMIMQEGIEKGRKEGIEKGRKEGIVQGRKEGIRQGKEEEMESGGEGKKVKSILTSLI